jgi:phosphoenolpyruvate carboxylase
VLAHALTPALEGLRADYVEGLEAVAAVARTAYRRLVEHAGFASYCVEASPLEELTLLNVGSRPPRRAGSRALADLRAIPWVFAWTQNRHALPGWYGVGSGLAALVDVRGERGVALLRAMFTQVPAFRLILDEVEKTLLTVDWELASLYADLVADAATRSDVLAVIRAEYETLIRHLPLVTGQATLGDRFPKLRARIESRLPMLAPVHREQVALLRRYRGAPSAAADDGTLSALLVSINCIAAGFGTTG